jgi:type II secretory pathway pseudopilin PulG
MKTTRTANRTPGGRSPLADEHGMLLVITMIVLLVISTLAAANLINAFLERSIAKNQNYANIALNAADAGVDAGIAWLGDTANRALIPTNAANCLPGGVLWTRTYARDITSGAHYTGSIMCKQDDQDRDLDGNTVGDIVLYNNVVATLPIAAGNNGRFGYLDAKDAVPGAGFPVMTVRSVGTFGGAGYREISVDIARVRDIPPGVKGAVTSKDPIGFGASNSQKKDGRAHALNGLLCDGSEGAPVPPCDCDQSTDGLYVETGAAVPCTNAPTCTVPAGCSCIGKAGTVFGDHGGVITENPVLSPSLCNNPWCVLGYATEADMLAAVTTTNGRVFGPGAGETPINNATISAFLETAPAGAIVVVRGSYTMTAGTNVDANHAKRLVVQGTFDALGATTFTGLLVAQNFDSCGNLVVNGALSCTGDSNNLTKAYANGGVAINYSCDALAAAVGQVGYTIRLGWKREY